ncbi:hypothetical protein STENM327S_02937 [Streptomyces tendae]
MAAGDGAGWHAGRTVTGGVPVRRRRHGVRGRGLARAPGAETRPGGRRGVRRHRGDRDRGGRLPLAVRPVPGESAYGAVRELFARELALAEADDTEHWTRWEAVYAEIERRVRLVSPDGPVAEFLLHIEGDRAWFRWSDEPFGPERAGD